MSIPLGLAPLQDVGTRVIVPFLEESDANSMKPGGELSAWLQRCWWRAIQTNKLEIRLVDDATGHEETIQPPSWWLDLPRENNPSAKGRWHDLPDEGRTCIWGDLAFGDGHLIRRLVILHSNDVEPRTAVLSWLRQQSSDVREAFNEGYRASKSFAIIPKAL